VRAMTELMDSVKDSRVRVTACFMRSKRPRFGSCGSGAAGWSGSAGRLPKREKAILFSVAEDETLRDSLGLPDYA
jgi:hypothetical protein